MFVSLISRVRSFKKLDQLNGKVSRNFFVASVNKVILIGNVGTKKLNQTDSGDPVLNMNLATTSSFKSKTSGQWEKSTEWHKLTIFGRLAESVDKWVGIGDRIYVEGSLKSYIIGWYNCSGCTDALVHQQTDSPNTK